MNKLQHLQYLNFRKPSRYADNITAIQAKPSLDLNFARNKSLMDNVTGNNLVTFTRASSGTYVDSAGVLQTAATDVPRFDHNPTTGESLGLLVEEQRTNLLLRSEDFSTTWGNDNTTEETNVVVAPNGTLTADKLVENTSASAHSIFQNVTAVIGTVYTFSAYAKRAGRDLQLLFGGSDVTGDPHANFDLTNGTVSATNGTITATITNIGNGWYRCAATVTSAVTTNFGCVIGLINSTTAARAVSYTGDGYSGIYIWGAQLEAGAFPTSYIPTTTAAATRAADVASITGTAFSSWYRQDEGTMFGEARTNTGTNLSHGLFSFHDGTTGNRMFTSVADVVAGDPVNTTVLNGGVTQAGYNAGSYSTKIAFAFGYAVNNFATAGNGSITTATSGTVPAVDRLFVGTTFTATTLNGTIRRLTYFPQRLSNANLQRITQ